MMTRYPVMPGYSRPKDGLAVPAYVPGIHVLSRQDVDARNKSGQDEERIGCRPSSHLDRLVLEHGGACGVVHLGLELEAFLQRDGLGGGGPGVDLVDQALEIR